MRSIREYLSHGSEIPASSQQGTEISQLLESLEDGDNYGLTSAIELSLGRLEDAQNELLTHVQANVSQIRDLKDAERARFSLTEYGNPDCCPGEVKAESRAGDLGNQREEIMVCEAENASISKPLPKSQIEKLSYRQQSHKERQSAKKDTILRRSSEEYSKQGNLTKRGLYGSKAAPPFSHILSKYFAGVGSTREKRAVAISAWLLTIISLIVCLVLVTRDFFNSQDEAASALSYKLTEFLDIPDTYICAQQVAFPDFEQLPTTKFPGKPYMWVDSIKMPGTNSSLENYPKTLSNQNIEHVNIDAFGKSCNSTGLVFADAKSFWSTLYEPPRCFNCILVKSNPAIRVMRSDVESQTLAALDNAAIASSFAVEVSQSNVVHSCRERRNGLVSSTYYVLLGEIIKHFNALRAKGILDLGDAEPRNIEDEKYIYFPRYRVSPIFGYEDFVCGDVADLFCNVYLFSGFFYPAAPSQQIAYKFNAKSRRWNRSPQSQGPYVPPRYEDWYLQPKLFPNGTAEQQKIGSLTKLRNPTYHLAQSGEEPSGRITRNNIFKILVNDSVREGAPLRQVAASPDRGFNAIFFVKHTRNSEATYTATNEAVPLRQAERDYSVRSFSMIHLTSKDFLTRSVSNQVTVQVSSFLADFFGLIEMFLDLSVYTVIISPITVFAKRRSIQAKLRTPSLEIPMSPV